MTWIEQGISAIDAEIERLQTARAVLFRLAGVPGGETFGSFAPKAPEDTRHTFEIRPSGARDIAARAEENLRREVAQPRPPQPGSGETQARILANLRTRVNGATPIGLAKDFGLHRVSVQRALTALVTSGQAYKTGTKRSARYYARTARQHAG